MNITTKITATSVSISIVLLAAFLVGRSCGTAPAPQAPIAVEHSKDFENKEKAPLIAGPSGTLVDSHHQYTVDQKKKTISVRERLAVTNELKPTPSGDSVVSTVTVAKVDPVTGERLDKQARFTTTLPIQKPPRWTLTAGGFYDTNGSHPFLSVNYRIWKGLSASAWATDYGPAAGLFVTFPLGPKPRTQPYAPVPNPQEPSPNIPQAP